MKALLYDNTEILHFCHNIGVLGAAMGYLWQWRGLNLKRCGNSGKVPEGVRPVFHVEISIDFF